MCSQAQRGAQPSRLAPSLRRRIRNPLSAQQNFDSPESLTATRSVERDKRRDSVGFFTCINLIGFRMDGVRMRHFQPNMVVLMKALKSSSLVSALVTVGFLTVLGTLTEAQSPSQSSPSMIVRGEVSQVEGEFHMAKDPQGLDTLDIVDKFYIITDRAGKELRLELSDDTKVLNRINPGDKIEAKISIEGHTLSVIRLKP